MEAFRVVVALFLKETESSECMHHAAFKISISFLPLNCSWDAK